MKEKKKKKIELLFEYFKYEPFFYTEVVKAGIMSRKVCIQRLRILETQGRIKNIGKAYSPERRLSKVFTFDMNAKQLEKPVKIQVKKKERKVKKISKSRVDEKDIVKVAIGNSMVHSFGVSVDYIKDKKIADINVSNMIEALRSDGIYYQLRAVKTNA